jgi:hypothetical protein
MPGLAGGPESVLEVVPGACAEPEGVPTGAGEDWAGSRTEAEASDKPARRARAEKALVPFRGVCTSIRVRHGSGVSGASE